MEEGMKKEEPQEVKKEEGAVPEKPLDKMTVVELREFALAKNLGIVGVSAMKKEELLPAIKEALGIKDEEPAAKVADKGTVAAMKKKIVTLKEEKKTAIASKDKKKTNVLRRRINRLKKRSKKVAKA
jgi:protein-arginine kinase activator protein McsA